MHVMSRSRARMRLAASVVAIILAVSAISSVVLSIKGRKLKITPAQHISLLRSEIVNTAHTIEKAYTSGTIGQAPYTQAKTQVLQALRVYNALLANFKKFGVIGESERAQVLALLAAAIKTAKDGGK